MNTYMKFINEAVGIPKHHDPVLRELLDLVCLHHATGNPMTVSRAMNLSVLASPATLHRKLDMLVADGFLTHEFEGKNRRTKYLVPTMSACAYMELMSKAIERAVKP